jgi:hypothetical protein
MLSRDEKPTEDQLESAPNSNPSRTQTAQEATESKKKEWIKYSPDSPRNWPAWRKWNIILGLNFFCTIIFIASNGFVTKQAEEQYGVSEVCTFRFID